MKAYQKYIIYHYLKNFFIILFALELFYVGVDLLTTYKKLPNSANLQILYTMFQGMYAINYVLPLSAVFSMIITVTAMIKSNELVSLYAFGVSKQSFIKPMFLTALSIILVYISLTFSSFSYAREYSNNILRFSQISTSTRDLFLKNGNKYIYFKKLDPIKKEANGIKIFKVLNRDLVSVISAKKGYYKEKNWVLYGVEKIIKPKATVLDNKGLVVQKFAKLEDLKDFRPKIIDNIYKGKFNLSILDAIDALKFYDAQGLDTSRIKTIIFSQIFLPLFAPLLIIIFIAKIPIISRYYNLTILSFTLSFIAVIVWGILFLLSKLAMNSVIMPELAIMAPIFLLGVSAFYSYFKE
ncbi:MAG: YjgP/YjgQ family permease [Epsilonproteobacteria bacterium]|nr:YjgP/YjgQ family permease [Campylobacterota bacterium]